MPPRLVRFFYTLLCTVVLSVILSLGASYLWDWLILQAYGQGMGPKQAFDYLLPWPDHVAAAIRWWPVVFGLLCAFIYLSQFLLPRFTKSFLGLLVVFSVGALFAYVGLEVWLGMNHAQNLKAHYDVFVISKRLPLFASSFVGFGLTAGLLFALMRQPWREKRAPQ